MIGPVAAAAVGIAALTGCGESSEQKAAKAVCSSVQAISTELTKLQSLSVSSKLPEEARASVNAISQNIDKLKKEAPNLEAARREEIEAANNAFKLELAQTASSALSAAKTSNLQSALETVNGQLKSAAARAGAAYKQAFQSLKCG